MKKRTPSVQPAKSYEILVSTPEAHKRVRGFIDEDKPSRKMMLDKYGRMIVHDWGVAQDIQQRFGAKKYGGDGSVTVIPVEATKGREKRRTFRVPHLPWKKE